MKFNRLLLCLVSFALLISSCNSSSSGSSSRKTDSTTTVVSEDWIFYGYKIEPGADLSGANLSGTNLTSAAHFAAGLNCVDVPSDVDLRGADLTGADLYRACLYETDFAGAIMPNGARFKSPDDDESEEIAMLYSRP